MCIREGRGPPALRTRDVEEEPAEEGSQLAGGREAERWRPRVTEARRTDTVLLLLPPQGNPVMRSGQGPGISEVTWKKAALGWGSPTAVRSAEVEMGEELGFGCEEEEEIVWDLQAQREEVF